MPLPGCGYWARRYGRGASPRPSPLPARRCVLRRSAGPERSCRFAGRRCSLLVFGLKMRCGCTVIAVAIGGSLRSAAGGTTAGACGTGSRDWQSSGSLCLCVCGRGDLTSAAVRFASPTCANKPYTCARSGLATIRCAPRPLPWCLSVYVKARTRCLVPAWAPPARDAAIRRRAACVSVRPITGQRVSALYPPRPPLAFADTSPGRLTVRSGVPASAPTLCASHFQMHIRGWMTRRGPHTPRSGRIFQRRRREPVGSVAFLAGRTAGPTFAFPARAPDTNRRVWQGASPPRTLSALAMPFLCDVTPPPANQHRFSSTWIDLVSRDLVSDVPCSAGATIARRAFPASAAASHVADVCHAASAPVRRRNSGSSLPAAHTQSADRGSGARRARALALSPFWRGRVRGVSLPKRAAKQAGWHGGCCPAAIATRDSANVHRQGVPWTHSDAPRLAAATTPISAPASGALPVALHLHPFPRPTRRSRSSPRPLRDTPLT